MSAVAVPSLIGIADVKAELARLQCEHETLLLVARGFYRDGATPAEDIGSADPEIETRRAYRKVVLRRVAEIDELASALAFFLATSKADTSPVRR